jgi:hypothetical protein
MSFFRVLDQLLVPFFLLFLFAGSLGGLALGGGLLLRTAATLRFMQSMNRWVSTRRATRELELPRQGLVPSKGLGVFLLVSGAVAGYLLLVRVHVPRAAFSAADPRFATALAVESIKWLMIAGSAVAIVLGLMALFAPDALARVQERMNRWVSTRALVPADSERMRTPLDLLVETHPRAAGWIIAAASLAIAVAMGLMIMARWLR